jgi:oxygen-dependent protoporphyrinogen oxidase
VAVERLVDDRWRVRLADGSALDADAVIVATEAWAAAPLLKTVDERLCDLIGEIPCSSSATVVMAFREQDCPFDKKWHGILAPMVEHRKVTGISLMSSKWPQRAPEGRVLLRGFLGGPRDQQVLEGTDEELIEIARREFIELLGIVPEARPTYARLFRWDGGMPQYTMEHLDRVARITEICAATPGLGVAGGAYHGVGVPNCLDSGEAAAAKVLAEWGISVDEDAEASRRVY